MTTGVFGSAEGALCRMIEARVGLDGVALYRRRAGRLVLVHATEAYRELLTSADGAVVAPGVALGDAPREIEPGDLGISAGSCLVQPFGAGMDTGASPEGLIVVAARADSGCGPSTADTLRDAAEIARHLPCDDPENPAVRGPPAVTSAGPLLPASAAGPALPPGPRSLSRAATHQLIASLLQARTRGEPLAFVMLDIDRFRAVNEALGTDAGDSALCATAARIETCLTPKDRLIRLEGDRFLVVTSPARVDVGAMADRLLAAVALPLDLPSRRVAMRASVGVVLASSADTSPVGLLMQADTALRRAKAAGGSRIEIHEPGLHAALLDRSLMELDLRHALDNGELGLVFQPYVDLASGRVSGVEALLRWAHPTRGEIAPTTFIPLAEATGSILPIGMWALRTACREAAGWHGRFMLSVNISPIQFHAPGFVEEVDAVLADTGFPAEQLELEITETVLMRDNPETTAQLKALIARGVRIALDDFGTGYSALAYLSRLPHHRIKLDKSFVQDITRPSTAGLVRAIIALARAGGIATTAEGVERPDQLEAVRAIGFTHAQGFATGLPVRHPAPLAEPLPS